MKTTFHSKMLRVVLGCALTAIATVSTTIASAQSQVVQAKIPFAFHYGSQRMPAGMYQLEIQSSGHVILLRGRSASGFLLANPETTTSAAGTGKLVFNRYGDQYFLSEIWPKGSATGERCVKTRQEKETELAQNAASPLTHEVALNQPSR
jgi:hypothetical protein